MLYSSENPRSFEVLPLSFVLAQQKSSFMSHLTNFAMIGDGLGFLLLEDLDAAEGNG